MTRKTTASPTAQLITIKEAAHLTTLSRTMINRYRAAGKFPEAVALGDRRMAFVRAEVEAWVAARIAARSK